jgi:hypothetical protein
MRLHTIVSSRRSDLSTLYSSEERRTDENGRSDQQFLECYVRNIPDYRGSRRGGYAPACGRALRRVTQGLKQDLLIKQRVKPIDWVDASSMNLHEELVSSSVDQSESENKPSNATGESLERSRRKFSRLHSRNL